MTTFHLFLFPRNFSLPLSIFLVGRPCLFFFIGKSYLFELVRFILSLPLFFPLPFLSLFFFIQFYLSRGKTVIYKSSYKSRGSGDSKRDRAVLVRMWLNGFRIMGTIPPRDTAMVGFIAVKNLSPSRETCLNLRRLLNRRLFNRRGAN